MTFDTEVWVDKDEVSAFTEGRVIVLGAGGALLDVGELYPVGSFLRLRFRFPPRFDDVICKSIVRNGLDRRGVGVEFLDLSPRDRERVSAFVEEHAGPAAVD